LVFAGSRQETVLSPVRRQAITTQLWNHAVWIARADRAHANPNLPQDLIDLDDGTIWEWEPEPAGSGEPGYALADDHDWAWPRARNWSASTGSWRSAHSTTPNSTGSGRSTSTRPRTTISDDQDRRAAVMAPFAVRLVASLDPPRRVVRLLGRVRHLDPQDVAIIRVR
jgi:hypothetical protein